MAQIKKSRLAMGNYHYVRYSFEYFLDSVKRLGIENIELWTAAPHFCLNTLTEAQLLEMKQELEDRNLHVVCVTPEQCSYPMNIAVKDRTLRSLSIELSKTAIDVAAELKADCVLVASGCGYFDKPKEEAWECSLASMKAILKHAEAKGVMLAYEPLSVYSSNIVNDVVDLKKMLDQMPSKYMKGMVDTGQLALAKEDIRDYPKLLGEKLAHVHILDATPFGHLALGDGNLPLGEYIDALEEGGYKGYYTLEITDIRYRHEPEKAVEKSIQWLIDHNKLIV